MITTAHIALGLAALAVGLVVLLRQKGTRSHRMIGWTFVVCLFGVNATALAMHNFNGALGPFHVFVPISLAGLFYGLYQVLKRPSGDWPEGHYYGMCFSYVGLLAATTAEIIVRVPYFRAAGSAWRLILLTTLASIVVTGVGWAIIARVRARVLGSIAGGPPADA